MPTEFVPCHCPRCQQGDDHPDRALHAQMNLLMSRLDEAQRRWYAALEAQRQGHGGDRLVAQITGLDEKTIRRAARCWASSRRKKDLAIVPMLHELVGPDTADDPMSGQKWVRRSLRSVSARLTGAGYPVSPPTVGRLLRTLDYALHVNAKQIEASAAHPDRAVQFDYIAEQRQAFAEAGRPIVSVDTKKKEVIGNFKNAGRTWRQEAEAVN